MTSGTPILACPKCGSTDVQSVPVKRSTVPEALAAEYFRANPALQRSDTISQGVCSRCGCRWIPRTSDERRLRALSGQLGAAAARAAVADDTAARKEARPWSRLTKRQRRSLIILSALLIVWVLGLLL